MIIFSYSGPSGILLGSDGKQNTVKARGGGGAWELLHFPLFSGTDSIKPSLLFFNIVGSLYFWSILFFQIIFVPITLKSNKLFTITLKFVQLNYNYMAFEQSY